MPQKFSTKTNGENEPIKQSEVDFHRLKDPQFSSIYPLWCLNMSFCQAFRNVKLIYRDFSGPERETYRVRWFFTCQVWTWKWCPKSEGNLLFSGCFVGTSRVRLKLLQLQGVNVCIKFHRSWALNALQKILLCWDFLVCVLHSKCQCGICYSWCTMVFTKFKSFNRVV